MSPPPPGDSQIFLRNLGLESGALIGRMQQLESAGNAKARRETFIETKTDGLWRPKVIQDKQEN